MATHQPRQHQLSRLFIPPSLNSQQPIIYGENVPMFSPSLPTSIQSGSFPPFPMHPSNLNPLQTPMQANFFPPQPPGAPGRPTMHRQHPSVAQLAAAGIFPPQAILPPQGTVPMTPLGQTGFPSPMIPGPQFQQMQPFIPKSKRTPSVNVGGPPKAVLGGPQRKITSFPAAVAVVQAATLLGKKKVIVNLPKETKAKDGERSGGGGDRDVGQREAWAREPIPVSDVVEQMEVEPPELTTIDAYPSDSWRYHIPPTVDVFLPGKPAWDVMKRRIIEEKLERLGVEKGSGSSVPHIHAPHARAASISSPADPALLYFKLNKLQQSQNNTASNSLSTSPQPPLQLSPSPSQSSISNGGSVPPRFQGQRHGHSMSLAQPPSFHHQPTSASPVYNPTAAFNPFGPTATLGSDQIYDRKSPGPGMETIHAPQGRVPANLASLAPILPLSRPESKPDFSRGFGLDVTEEEEEPEEDEEEEDEDAAVADLSQSLDEGDTEDAEVESRDDQDHDGGDADVDADMELDLDEGEEDEDGMSTVGQSRIHSRHVSKLSVALSLVSVGRAAESAAELAEEIEIIPSRSPVGEVEIDMDPAEEWTGSEDLEGSEYESIGEFSNPSDEEKARQARRERRMHKKSKRPGSDTPRRIPNFPQPPDSAPSYHAGVDDDIISNPSEEEHAHEVHMPQPFLGLDQREHFVRPESNLSGHGRPLPPVPHSRGPSSQFSFHDPSLAHSRDGSSNLPLGGLHPRPVPHATFDSPPPTAQAPRKDSLNPFAKPFVFGTSAPAATFGPTTGSVSHVRVPSLGKPLNAAAQEFKPGGFTFQPPPGVPQLNFAVPRPLPAPPAVPAVSESPARASQGREKRQRRGSGLSVDDSDVDEEDEDEEEVGGKDTMTSFKFPPSAESPKLFRHSAPTSPPAKGLGELGKDLGLVPIAKSFTISGSGPSTLLMPEDLGRTHYPASEGGVAKNVESPGMEETTLRPDEPQPEAASELPFPPTAKPKRAPIPLDFKHPVSTSTVPAAVFKNLNNENTEERTRRTVRSRLSSRDIFEHSPRPSLDDLHVPPISHRITRMFTDPGFRERELSPERDDIFASGRRRTSLPPRHSAEESISDVSIAPMNLSRRIEMQQYEQRLEALLDEKVDGIRRTLEELKEKQAENGGQTLNPSTEAMISEVVSLFRTQLQESAARGLEESQMDARGELDFEVLKDIIEQSHAEVRNQIHRDISELVLARDQGADLKAFTQQLSERTVNAVVSATSQISNHVHALERSRPSPTAERDAIVMDVVNALTPHLSSLRAEPIDYEGLTMQLTQAVKPHITQLIDLASDKRETAGLIVERLVPILPSLQPPTPKFDADDLVSQLTTEMRRIIGPLDAHEIKEQVSDLVVERLDSRLAVRDKAFNVELVTEKVTESISGLLSPLEDLKAAIDDIAKTQRTAPEPPVIDTSGIRQDVLSLLSDLPDKLVTATDALGAAREELKSSQQQQARPENPSAKVISKIDHTLASVAEEQKKLVNQNTEFSDFCQAILKHIDALPETLVEATKVLQNVHTDIMARDTSEKDAEEIRKLMNANSDLQVNLAKARGAHGQVRVEKEMLDKRLRATEVERDRARERVDEVQSEVVNKHAEVAALEARNVELESALSQALERIKSSDVSTQASQERISALEKSAQELANENHQLKTKVHTLDATTAFLTREKEALLEDVNDLKRKNDELSSQDNQWEELRRTNEAIQALTALVSSGDNEELKELRRSRDKFKVLEGEHAALQRRLKEQENKAVNSERAASTARQSLSQAQQRAIEWEKRAKDHESELQSVRSELEQAEESNTNLDADLSLVKLQLDERDAEERLAKDRESKLRDQIAALEEQVARLQAETDQAKKAAAAAQAQASVPTPPTSSVRPRQNGYKPVVSRALARPDSRASTINGDTRSATPNAGTNGDRPTSPQPSVWDSIHAPMARRENTVRLPSTPKARAPLRNTYFRPQIPSPTPSNVSMAPTLQGDGWWS